MVCRIESLAASKICAPGARCILLLPVQPILWRDFVWCITCVVAYICKVYTLYSSTLFQILTGLVPGYLSCCTKEPTQLSLAAAALESIACVQGYILFVAFSVELAILHARKTFFPPCAAAVPAHVRGDAEGMRLKPALSLCLAVDSVDPSVSHKIDIAGCSAWCVWKTAASWTLLVEITTSVYLYKCIICCKTAVIAKRTKRQEGFNSYFVFYYYCCVSLINTIASEFKSERRGSRSSAPS